MGKRFKELQPDRKTSALLNWKRVENSSVSRGYSLFYFFKTCIFIQRDSASKAQPFDIFGMTTLFGNIGGSNYIKYVNIFLS